MIISLIVEWVSTILFIIATKKMSGKYASNPKVRLRALWMFLIGSSCLITFALFLGAWKFILYFDLDSVSGVGLLVGQSFIVYYDIGGIINCKKELRSV